MILSSLACCRRDERGAISMEFTLLFPVLMLLLITTFGFFTAFRAADVHTKVAFAINDIVSRGAHVTTADLEELALVQRKMLPDEITQQALRITSVCFGGGAHRVMWSFVDVQEGAPPLQVMTDDTIPAEILPSMVEQDSVLLTEMQARWEPAIAGFGVGGRTLSSQLAIRPRIVKMVPWLGVAQGNTCPRS